MKTRIIPVVIRALGAGAKKFHAFVKQLDIIIDNRVKG